MHRSLLTLLAGGLVVLAAPAFQEGGLKSGPQPGTGDKPSLLPGPFHAINVTGDFTGRPHCLVCEYGLNPAVLVFAREPSDRDRPLTRLLQGLAKVVEEGAHAKLGAGAVFLNDDKGEASEAFVARVNDLAKELPPKRVTLAVATRGDLQDYAIHEEADVTVVLFAKHEVKGNFAFRKDTLRDADADAIVARVRQMLPPKPPEKKKAAPAQEK